MDIGKTLRWRRFCANDGHALLVPIDHGLTMGPLPGIESTAAMSRWIGHSAITGIVAHKGIVARLAARHAIGAGGVMMHLNGMSALAPEPDRKEMVTDVEIVVRLGADAVSLQVNFNGVTDARNLQMLGSVVDAAQRFGLPVLTMLYDKVRSSDPVAARKRLRQWMRAAIELGTDAIKIGAPAHIDEIEPLLDGLADDVAVLFAGGDVAPQDDEVIALAQAARRAGALGLCVGRNVFGRPNPAAMLERLRTALATEDGSPHDAHAGPAFAGPSSPQNQGFFFHAAAE